MALCDEIRRARDIRHEIRETPLWTTWNSMVSPQLSFLGSQKGSLRFKLIKNRNFWTICGKYICLIFSEKAAKIQKKRSPRAPWALLFCHCFSYCSTFVLYAQAQCKVLKNYGDSGNFFQIDLLAIITYLYPSLTEKKQRFYYKNGQSSSYNLMVCKFPSKGSNLLDYPDGPKFF